ncbi:hypothetical protein PIB30_106820, partial [Stylosanthes scabra]|nr:hypothetical protein [Stylosanthes scabra]
AATMSLFWTKRLRDTTGLCLAASKLVKSDQKARDGQRLCITVWTEFSASCNNMKKKRKSR